MAIAYFHPQVSSRVALLWEGVPAHELHVTQSYRTFSTAYSRN